jgi:hypothetical protein
MCALGGVRAGLTCEPKGAGWVGGAGKGGWVIPSWAPSSWAPSRWDGGGGGRDASWKICNTSTTCASSQRCNGSSSSDSSRCSKKADGQLGQRSSLFAGITGHSHQGWEFTGGRIPAAQGLLELVRVRV